MNSLKVLNYEFIKLLEDNQLLSPLIKREFIKDTLKSTLLSETELENIKAHFNRENNLESEEKYNQWLVKNNLTEKEFLNQLTFPTRVNKYCVLNFKDRAHTHFLDRKNNLDQVTYSLIRVKDVFEARELYYRIKDGESDFGEIAKNFSKGPEQDSRGVVGPIPLTSGHEKVVSLLKSLSPGEMKEPINVGSWWLIIRLESLQEAILDREMQLNLSRELFHEWVDEEVEGIIKKLKTKFHTKDESKITEEK